jgi:hypothetical protein
VIAGAERVFDIGPNELTVALAFIAAVVTIAGYFIRRSLAIP